ncbi:prenyltransferase alpha subunit repeat-containing 1 [Schistosoma japonicum]|nr:prenyltransferase alpha subunit repeat-containing 1 [Schistosoma japonicum]
MKSLKPIKSYVILSQHHIRLTFLLSVDLLNCLLLIAPDTTTFWNYKRQSLQNNKLSSSCEIKIHSSSDNVHRINFSSNEFLNWVYKNKICHEPSTLQWIDLLCLRYLFLLSEYLTDSL